MNAVRAEILKLVTLPALAITAGLTWAVTALLRLAAPDGSVLMFSQVGFLVLGVLAATQDYQDGQIRTALLAVPRRPLLAVVKAAAPAVAAAPVALLVAITAGEPGNTGFLILDVLLAAAVGTVVRVPVGAVAGLLTGYFIVLPLAAARFDGVESWIPAQNAAALIWTAVAVGVAAVTLVRRNA